MFVHILSVVVILAMMFPATMTVYAAPSSPFLGQWRATDVDGSDIRLSIAGRPDGPFQITWTESYISYCSGGAGIVRGTGWLVDRNPNLLEADLHLECFTTAAQADFHMLWRYHPVSNSLSSRDESGVVTIWKRPGGNQALSPALGLRVNYGDNWVESFYEGGHVAWLMVTEGDGITIKATAELVTEPKDYWGGETGFQSLDAGWFDAEGNPMENPPDIKPYDWVFGWVDNGASAQVQVGNIKGVVTLATDSIGGTIDASWINDPVQVECLDWGSGQEQPYDNKDGGVILTNDSDPYSCSWAGEWDIQNGQAVGVGYFSPDGHWVANVFRNPQFTVFPEWNYIEAWEWPDGMTVTAAIEGKCSVEGTVGYLPDNPWSTFVPFELPDTCDVAAGDIVTLSDGTTSITYTVQNLAITDVDRIENTVTGTADSGTVVHNWVHGFDDIDVSVTAAEGSWTADFDPAGVDLEAGLDGRSSIFNDQGNATVIEWWVPMKYFISSTDDVLANDGVCTLREAVISANTNSPSGDMEGECQGGMDHITDFIILAADQTYSLTTDSGCDDDPFCGDLDIWDNSVDVDLVMTVDGDGSSTISQDAVVDDRVLENQGATVQIDRLILTGGNEGGSGGGVLNIGTLYLNGSEVSANFAGWSGGGIFNVGTLKMDSSSISANTATNGGGGGITNFGSLTLTNSTVSANISTYNDGGGIANAGELIVDASVLSGNSAPGSGGGALANFKEGTATIQNKTQVYGNSAGTGALFNYGTLTVIDSAVFDNTADYGGGLSNWGGMLTLTNSTVSDNEALASAGGIHNKDGGTTTIDDHSVISGNTAFWDGGGVNNWEGNVNIYNSTVSGNLANQSGGGVINSPAGTITLNGSTVMDNSAGNEGGGLSNWGGTVSLTASTIDHNWATGGAGIFTSGGTLTLDDSTVSDNTASGGDGGIQIKDGAIVTVQNGSVISGNSAPNGYGGGITNWGSTLTIDASSVTGNSAVFSAGGILNKDGGTTTIQNGSTIFNNTARWEGGISNWGGSTLAIDSSTISYNTATDSSGGIGNLGTMTVNASIISGNAAPVGGGVFNKATLTITGSAIINNVANFGGGLLNVNGTLTVKESAFIGNTATDQGGAFYNYVDSFYDVSITDSCVVGNSDTSFFNESTILLTATGNWWGDPAGPGGYGSGAGDSVSDHITFDPWLDAPPAICVP